MNTYVPTGAMVQTSDIIKGRILMFLPGLWFKHSHIVTVNHYIIADDSCQPILKIFSGIFFTHIYKFTLHFKLGTTFYKSILPLITWYYLLQPTFSSLIQASAQTFFPDQQDSDPHLWNYISTDDHPARLYKRNYAEPIQMPCPPVFL